MGVVFLAKDVSLEREVAVKILAQRYANDERVAKRFRREAVAMASVRNEHVVQIFAFGDHEGRPYFVMEYVPGYTVANLIENANQRREQLYFDVVLGILSQVCRGLQAVHDAGIVHRDVKPANMLIGPGFRVALTDFGLVEMVEEASRGRDLAGTPLYLAPELIKRQKLPDSHRYLSDIYSLGVSAYEMLTGDVPFDGRTIQEILRRHVNQAPKPVSDIRSDLPIMVDEVLAKALSKDPEHRYRASKDFLVALTGSRRSGEYEVPLRSGTSTILLADGDEVTRQIFATALKVGFPHALILTAADGLNALEVAKSTRLDLIVVDLDLPELNGLEVCAALRGDELTAEVPLVVVTSRFEGNSRNVLRSLGITDTLLKPVEATHLVHVARTHLDPEEEPL